MVFMINRVYQVIFLKKGDEVIIIGPTTGIIQKKIQEIRVDHKKVEIANKGDRFSTPIDTIIRRSDKLYKILETSEANSQENSTATKYSID